MSSKSPAGTYLLLNMNYMENVTKIQQLWCGYSNYLKEPEANVRDGESKVVADVLAARLLRVAHKVRLLITPNLERHDTSNSKLREHQLHGHNVNDLI